MFALSVVKSFKMKQREIKFRAWDEETKSMIYCDADIFMSLDGLQIGHWKKGWKELKLMQYTGLKDKNGIEIYEGDIIKLVNWIDEDVVAIKFGEYSIGNHEYAVGWYFYVKRNRCEYPFTEGVARFEVIGNIYKNKDLLK